MTGDREQRLVDLCRDFCRYGELLGHIRLCRDLGLSQPLLEGLQDEATRLQERLEAVRAQFLVALDLPEAFAYQEAAQRLAALLVDVRREALGARARALSSGSADSIDDTLKERCREFLEWVETIKEGG